MLDEMTRALVMISYEHHEIHEGSLFYAEFVDATMVDTNKLELIIVTPDTTRHAHMFFGVSVTGASTTQIYQDVTTSADGTAVTRKNRHGNSSNTATVVVTHTPTITNDGALFQTKYCGATGKFSADGEDQRSENEWLLKQNTKYLFRLTADANIKGKIFCNWYEHIHWGF